MGTDPDLERAFEDIVEGYLDHVRGGSNCDVTEFADQHPAYSNELKSLLPMLLAMEELAGSQPRLEDAGQELREKTAITASERLGEYEIVRTIGRGGMGVVYEAKHLTLGRHVALKVLDSRSHDQSFVQRFEREARALAKLHHSGIVPIYEVGSHEGTLFYAMQLIEGASLDRVILELQRVKNQKPKDGSNVSSVVTLFSQEKFSGDSSSGEELSIHRRQSLYYRRIAKVGLQIADALDYAHCNGVLHRDIKPANLILDLSGNAWVTDFGLATVDNEQGLTRTGDIIGTLRYLAPEAMQCTCDRRSEVYSLGLSLYELLARQPAFGESDRYRLLHSILNNKPCVLRSIDSKIPVDLETIIEKACERDPSARYQTADQMASDLRRFLNDEPIHARRVGLIGRAVRWGRRDKKLASALASVALLLICFAIGASMAVLHFYDLSDRLEASVADLQDARNVAIANEETVSRNLYYARMLLAGNSAAFPGGTHRVQEMLADWTPDRTKQDWRGWEWYYLKSHCNRASIVVEDILSPIYWTDWTPDGELFATSGDGRDIEIWNAADGTHVRQLTGHNSSVKCVEWSPDGSTLVSVGGTRAILWDRKTGEQQLTLDHHPLRAHRAAWSPAGDKIAIGVDGEIRIVTADARLLQSIRVGSRPVKSIQWHPDGKSILAPFEGSNFAIWKVETAEMQKVFKGHRAGVRAVQFNPSGTRLASVSHDRTVRIWDTISGQEVRKIDLQTSGRTINWHPDGQSIVVSGDDRVARIIEIETSHPLRYLYGHTNVVACACFSPDGSRILTGSADSSARIWDRHRGASFTLPSVHNGNVDCVRWSPDGGLLLSASGDRSVTVWNALKNRQLLRFQRHEAYIRCAEFSFAGTRVASGDDKGKLLLWDLPLGKIQFEFELPESIFSVCWASKHRLLVGLEDGTIYLVDAASGSVIQEIEVHQDVVLALALSHDGRRLASCSADRTVKVWDTKSWECQATLKGASQRVNSIAWSPDDRSLVAASTDSRLRIYSLQGDEEPRVLRGHNGRVFAVSWSPDGSRIASGGTDRMVRIWDPASGEMTLSIAGNSAGVHSVAFHPDGRKVAVGSRDFTARVLDASPAYDIEVSDSPRIDRVKK